jgi:6-phosphogluconolactonase
MMNSIVSCEGRIDYIETIVKSRLNKIVKIFPNPLALAETFAGELAEMVIESAKRKRSSTIALSGGSTPELLFSVLGEHYNNSIPWKYVHFFWGDERCVSQDDKESNYGMTKRYLLDKIDIPSSNIHRIRGEDDPEKEVLRYSDEINDFVSKKDGIPIFDLVILGLGEDGHTASIFPNQKILLNAEQICAIAIHSGSGQKRITLTGRIICNAAFVVFMVTGKKKAEVVEKILKDKNGSEYYPASHIVTDNGILQWLLDADAGSLL